MHLAVITLLQKAEAAPVTLTLAGVAGIFITAAPRYIGGFITSRAQARLEYEKWVRARSDDVR
jgi:hypothetical protein